MYLQLTGLSEVMVEDRGDRVKGLREGYGGQPPPSRRG